MVVSLPGAIVIVATGAMVFGKLPAHGDFVARGLAAGERDGLDAWLSGSLAEAKAALGDDFDDIYDCAPPWRFASSEGGGAAGAIAASVDAVGRRYPILVRRTVLSGDTVASTAEACEALLFDALSGGWDADRLAAAVAAVAPDAGAGWTGRPTWWTEGSERFMPDRLAGDRPPGLMRRMLSMEASA